MPDPLIIQVIKQYRSAVDDLDLDTINDLTRRWIDTMNLLQKDIDRLAQEIARRQSVGAVITQQMLWKMETYQRMMKELSALVKAYTDQANRIITKAQGSAFILGIEAADAAIAVGVREIGAVSPLWEKINVSGYLSALGAAQDGSPLAALLQASYGLAADGITDAILNGVARGMGAKQIADDMVAASGMGLERALLISRTEVARAYRVGSVEEYRKSGVVRGFYRMVKKATACFGCLMLDGQRFELADDLTDHPRGKCDVIADVMGMGRPDWELGKDWFQDLTPDQQAARMGKIKYQMWQNGEVSLDDLIGWTRSDIWGDHPRIKTLRELGYVPPAKPPKLPPDKPAPSSGGGSGVSPVSPAPISPAPVVGSVGTGDYSRFERYPDVNGVIGSRNYQDVLKLMDEYEHDAMIRKHMGANPRWKLEDAMRRGMSEPHQSNMYKVYFGSDFDIDALGADGNYKRLKVYWVGEGEVEGGSLGFLDLRDAEDYVKKHPRAKVYECSVQAPFGVMTGRNSEIIFGINHDDVIRKVPIKRDVMPRITTRKTPPDYIRHVENEFYLSDFQRKKVRDYIGVLDNENIFEEWTNADELAEVWGAFDDIKDRFAGYVPFDLDVLYTPRINGVFYNATYSSGLGAIMFNGEWKYNTLNEFSHYVLSARGVACHELGHAIYRGFSPALRQRWVDIYDKYVHTGKLKSRANDSESECFAEAVSAYMEGDGGIPIPEIMEFMDDL